MHKFPITNAVLVLNWERSGPHNNYGENLLFICVLHMTHEYKQVDTYTYISGVMADNS